jgi:hypothetical protein
VDSGYRFDNCLQRLAFLSNHIDGYSVEVNEASAGALGGSPFYQYRSGSGKASPLGCQFSLMMRMRGGQPEFIP